MESIAVITPRHNYQIVFGSDFQGLCDALKALNNNYSKIAIISDDIVLSLYGDELEKSLKSLEVPCVSFAFQHGEANKHLRSMEDIYAFLIEEQLDRKSLLIALGGGVVGDMTGFAAATYMRGVDFIQVPTTLLAQVDSSIGGKTGVDFKGYKNMIGAFYQPQLVYINTTTLQTLPAQEFSSGMGEVIKHGLIVDIAYFEFLKESHKEILERDHNAIVKLISGSCKIKASVVSEDEKEMGLRAILNFGHTAGHAIERLMNFKLSHGACVGLGMVAAAWMSYYEGHLSEEQVRRVEAMNTLYELPLYVEGLSIDQVYLELFHDKKTNHQQLNFVLLKDLGSCYIHKAIQEDIVKNGLKKIIC